MLNLVAALLYFAGILPFLMRFFGTSEWFRRHQKLYKRLSWFDIVYNALNLLYLLALGLLSVGVAGIFYTLVEIAAILYYWRKIDDPNPETDNKLVLLIIGGLYIIHMFLVW